MNYQQLPVTPEEDEIFSRFEEQTQDYFKLAVVEAQRFVEGRSAAELSITTLRKAFEMGYISGWDDSVRRQKKVSHEPKGEQLELFGLQTR
jgi:hypothetical protein